jgi:anti-sigma B factor antagonist
VAFERIDPSEQIPEAELLEPQTPLDPPLTHAAPTEEVRDAALDTVDEAGGRWQQHTPATPTTSIRTTSCDDWRAAIELRGELDLARAPQLRSELQRHRDAGRRIIRIDTGRLTFIDSTIINELLTASAWCRREHGALILTNLPPRIRRVITLTGLDGLLLIDTAPQVPQPGPH